MPNGRLRWSHCSSALIINHSLINFQFSSCVLEQRLIRFAIDVVTLVGELPRSPQSRADFIHKLKVCLKELYETAIGFEYVGCQDFLSRQIAENTELCKILVASIQTARRNELKSG